MDFAIALDYTIKIPIHRQLYEELRHSILSGRLAPGQRVPSTRSLARSLGISRATVTLSYEQLLSEGYLRTIPSSGTFVYCQLPDILLQPATIQPTQEARHQPVQLSAYGANLVNLQLLMPSKTELPINFSCYGRPALDEFPLGLWRRLLARACQLQPTMLDYATSAQGYEPLRQAIARYIARTRAVRCEVEQIIIVNGSQQALNLVARLLVERGDLVAVENPGYLDARQAFLLQEASLVSIPVDESGILVDRLITDPAAKIKLVYVTPSHQFPTGAVLSLSRRLALLAWAQQTGALIVEDDYDSEYRYSDRPIPALQGLTINDSVIYIGTFSKVIFPALRLGYLVVPQSLVPIFACAKLLSDRQSSILEQYALTEFINEGHLESHVRRMRSLYNQRRQTLVQALKQYFGNSVTILGENAGMHLMVRFHTDLSDEQIVLQAAQIGVGLVSASPYYLETQSTGEFIFGYADLSEEIIQAGVSKLARVLIN